jgi:hypothetical protein
MYMYIQSQVSYASYQKAQCSVQGGTCCMPGCDNDTEPEHDGYELQGFAPICTSCDIMLTDYAPEVMQLAPMTRIFIEDGVVKRDSDDMLPF